MDKAINLTTKFTLEEAWQKVLEKLAKTLKKPSFETWIKPTKLIEIENSYVTIAVKNEFARNFIGQSFLDSIQKALNEVFAASLGVRLVVDESMVIEDEGQASIASIATVNLHNEDKDSQPNFNVQILNKLRKCETNLIDKFRFDNFVVGESNKFAHKLARAIADNKFDSAPVFISSESGLGKTHIMNAIGNEFNSADKRIRYVSSEQFANELINSIKKGNTSDFRKKYRELDLLLIDDVQFLQNKKSSQEEFFHTFNDIVHGGGQLVIASDRDVSKLSLEPRLKSRISGAVTAEIVRPEYETRLQILEKISAEENLGLGTDVLEVIAKRFPNSIRELEGAMCRLQAYKSFADEAIDDETVVKLFGTYRHGGAHHGLKIETIANLVADYFGVSIDELTGTSRIKDLAKARHIAIYLAYDLLKISYARIGQYFSDRKHSSVIHSVRTVESDIKTDRSLSLVVDDIKSKLH